MSCFQYIIALLLAASILINCGGAGNSENGASSGLVSTPGGATVSGVISNQVGNQAEMAGWLVSLYEKETGIHKVGLVDAAGFYSIKAINLKKEHGMILISPEYIVQAVFAQPSAIPGQIHSFFTLSSQNVPPLIHRGPVVNPQNLDGIAIDSGISLDANLNGIPDGAEAILATSALTNLSLTTDIDADGIINIEDTDLDADGVPNNIDSDDDNDALPDIYDDDSNGDGISDMVQRMNDQHYSEIVDWVAVKLELITAADTSVSRHLTFAVQLKDDITLPTSVNIRGSNTLLTGASVASLAADNTTTIQAWEESRALLDDGLNQDSRANDRLYARKIILGAGLAPVNQQLALFDLVYGTGDSAWALSFPHLFPAIVTNGITGTYTSTTRTITLVGQPFGVVTDFTWNVSIYWDNAGTDVKVFVSPFVLGSTPTYVLPDYILDTTKIYKFKINAQLRDRVVGYASYVVESPITSLASTP